MLLESLALVEGKRGVQKSVDQDKAAADVVYSVQVLLDDHVDVNVAGDVIGSRENPPGLGEVPADKQSGDYSEKSRYYYLGLGPVRAFIEPQLLPPVRALERGNG